MSKPGHNSKVQAGPIAGERLKSFVERIERLEHERKEIAGDIRDIYAEAKGVGYDVKTVRWVVQERRMDASDRAERDTLRDVYQHALDTAVGLVRGGLSLREAGRITGASKSSIHRALAVPSVSQPAGPKPEDGDDGITESCGDAGSASATHNSHHVGHAEGAVAAPPVSPHDTDHVPDARNMDEAPATPSVGAVAAEPRVAISVLTPHVTTDDDLTIPAYLRGPSPANRRVA